MVALTKPFAILLYSRFLCKYRLLKRVSYLLIFVTRKNEIFIFANRDQLFFPFVNRTRGPLSVRPSFIELRISRYASDLVATLATWECSSMIG